MGCRDKNCLEGNLYHWMRMLEKKKYLKSITVKFHLGKLEKEQQIKSKGNRIK